MAELAGHHECYCGEQVPCGAGAHWNLLVKIGNENEAMRELLRDLRRHFSANEVAFEEQPTAWYRDRIDALLNDGSRGGDDAQD